MTYSLHDLITPNPNLVCYCDNRVSSDQSILKFSEVNTFGEILDFRLNCTRNFSTIDLQRTSKFEKMDASKENFRFLRKLISTQGFKVSMDLVSNDIFYESLLCPSTVSENIIQRFGSAHLRYGIASYARQMSKYRLQSLIIF